MCKCVCFLCVCDLMYPPPLRTPLSSLVVSPCPTIPRSHVVVEPATSSVGFLTFASVVFSSATWLLRSFSYQTCVWGCMICMGKGVQYEKHMHTHPHAHILSATVRQIAILVFDVTERFPPCNRLGHRLFGRLLGCLHHTGLCRLFIAQLFGVMAFAGLCLKEDGLRVPKCIFGLT